MIYVFWLHFAQSHSLARITIFPLRAAETQLLKIEMSRLEKDLKKTNIILSISHLKG